MGYEWKRKPSAGQRSCSNQRCCEYSRSWTSKYLRKNLNRNLRLYQQIKWMTKNLRLKKHQLAFSQGPQGLTFGRASWRLKRWLQMIKIRQNQLETQGVSQLPKNFLNTTEKWERKRRREEVQSNPKTRRIQAPRGQDYNQKHYHHSHPLKFFQ